MRVVVIGGGIAGVSVAYALAAQSRERGSDVELVVVEAEQALALHATGRSAAQYIKNYGDGPAKALTVASFDFLNQPPPEFCDRPLLSPRGQMTVADPAHEEVFEQALTAGRHYDPSIAEIDMAQAAEIFPPLRPGRFVRASVEPNSSDIDVAALHQTFVRGVRAVGGRFTTSFRVDSVRRPAGESGIGADPAWVVESAVGRIGCDVVVNAAGAWGDVVASTAGIKRLGLTPMRRTTFTIACDEPGLSRWPLVAPVQHSWWAKPDGPQLLCSPANEDPMPPCDARPVELDIARAIEVINADTTLGIRSIRNAWAGLRTFTPDRVLALGPDPQAEDFFWCVGQGGIGIQTSPAAGRYLAEVITDSHPGAWATEAGIDPELLDPGRFR